MVEIGRRPDSRHCSVPRSRRSNCWATAIALGPALADGFSSIGFHFLHSLAESIDPFF